MRQIFGGILGVGILMSFLTGVVLAVGNDFSDKEALARDLTAEKIEIAVPDSVKLWPKAVSERAASGNCNMAGVNTGNTGTTKVRIIDCVKTVYYQIEAWGNVVADVEDFREKVAETLADGRGWSQIMDFKEVESGGDVKIILAEPARVGALAGCSSELSCTTWANQVVINDLRWREGTEASRAAGMSTRDYQHMVINHELGHWLGHYSHVESCPNGGPAPIMLQQSTGLRGCDSFNVWPLDEELWTLR